MALLVVPLPKKDPLKA